MSDESDSSEPRTPVYDIEINCAKNIAVVTWSGDLTMSAFLTFTKEFLEHPDFRKDLDRLYDFRDAKIDLQSDQFRTIYKALQDDDAVHGKRKVAFLVAKNFDFGLMRMFSSIADRLSADMAVFRDRNEANTWLGLPSSF